MVRASRPLVNTAQDFQGGRIACGASLDRLERCAGFRKEDDRAVQANAGAQQIGFRVRQRNGPQDGHVHIRDRALGRDGRGSPDLLRIRGGHVDEQRTRLHKGKRLLGDRERDGAENAGDDDVTSGHRVLYRGEEWQVVRFREGLGSG